jgi:hypothetical protein
MIDFAGASGAEGRWWEALLPGLQKFEDTLNKVLDMLADFEALAEDGLAAFADGISDTFAGVAVSVGGIIGSIKTAFTETQAFLKNFAKDIDETFKSAKQDVNDYSKIVLGEFKQAEKGAKDLTAAIKTVGQTTESLLDVFPWLKPPKTPAPGAPGTPKPGEPGEPGEPKPPVVPHPPGVDPGPPDPEPPDEPVFSDPPTNPVPPPIVPPIVRPRDEVIDYTRLGEAVAYALQNSRNTYVLNITSMATAEPLARDFAILESMSKSAT